MTKTKWLIYTVVLGILPLLARLLVALLSTKAVKYFSAGDIVGFGIALTISNISGLEHADKVDVDWKTLSLGLSLIAALLLTGIFFVACMADASTADFSSRNILIASAVLTLATLIHSYSVWDRLIKSKGASS